MADAFCRCIPAPPPGWWPQRFDFERHTVEQKTLGGGLWASVYVLIAGSWMRHAFRPLEVPLDEASAAKLAREVAP